MTNKLYYQLIVEELVWDTITDIDSINQIKYVKNGINLYCPGDYDLVYDPKYIDNDLLVNCGSLKLYLLFKNKNEKTYWLLKYS
jgi:hypothetical protein